MNSYSIVVKAQTFAHAAHDSIGQKRKYTGLPYWVHTDEVAHLVASVTKDPETIAAAHLHDVLEDVAPINDVPFGPTAIIQQFGRNVYDIVTDLTDVYIKDFFPHLNRKQRKIEEAKRLWEVSPQAQTVKLADLISNSRDIVQNDPGFARTYLKEKEVILKGLTRGNSELFKVANEVLHLGKKKLGIK